MDLQQLADLKKELESQKASPDTAAVLSILPGAGHFYAGQFNKQLQTRGAWVLGGFAGTLLLSFLGSYLLSSINNDMGRTAAILVNVVPTSAYWAWSISDAYYQTSLNNQDLESRIDLIKLKQKEYGYNISLLQTHF